MNEKDDSMDPGFDPDTAPDLSRGDWPEKFARVPVRRGRPRLERPRKSTTIRLSQEVIDYFKADGPGWQTRINTALCDWIRAKG